MKKYIIGIDQSTQGTKALLFDESGILIERSDRKHKQIISEEGWISHDLDEIYQNVQEVIRNVLEKKNIDPNRVACLGICNQRETSCIWERGSGKPLAPAVVWQCSRAQEICKDFELQKKKALIFQRTGLELSPYFSAAKIAWLLKNVKNIDKKIKRNEVCHGTIDSYLIYRLTEGEVYATDYSNASRTQLFNIFSLNWDEEICNLFGINVENMPKVIDSNACFGYTDCNGLFPHKIPIHAVMGDSQAALFGQNCIEKGKLKVTYGTGSSIMMNVGEAPVLSSKGLTTSLAWSINGKVQYVLEGNLNYAGAVVTWLKDNLELIDDVIEIEKIIQKANCHDQVYLVPAFSGLGAPYWNAGVRAAVIGMDRTTGKAEIVRAALECISYQITDILDAMREDSGQQIDMIRADGGAAKNRYLMQFQSDISRCSIQVSGVEELSGMGAAYMAGITMGVWNYEIMKHINHIEYTVKMDKELADSKYAGWINAVRLVNRK